ncbi:N-acetylmuramoyl-L-alanine amidase family protein [Aquibacillus saliphilus]|uniref:N-acetylmuramoyl-L-alanine amidase family protein n=1 Tax=Aquibacillus saliphilus TaxID=1909422 RepID=UPI001CF08BFD
MKPILIIDPGHGGADPGGGSNQYWIEKDMNLKISIYQYRRFQQLNFPVAITRSNDTTLTNEKRTKIVRDSGAAYCISNHINAGGGDGGEIIHSIYSNGKLAKVLAGKLQKSGQNVRRIFTRTLPSGIGQDYYFMIRETGKVQTNIIEYGFADSEMDDIKQLRNHWQDYAEAVVLGICQYCGYSYFAPRGRASVINQTKTFQSMKDQQFIGKRVESKVDGLRFYNKPSWGDNALVNTINKGIGFPKILARVRVGEGFQYQVENSNGQLFYLTANEKFVRIT